ncbi:MAG: sugar phosphate isomerase/epimerase family protein [Opitutaceae bacterium]
MKPILALSTSWCSHRHEDGHAMLEEMAALGFSHVELSHGIRITLVPGILRAVQEGVVKISSTHNFCPLPTGVMRPAPNLYEPSSLDDQEHDQWLRHTKRSIEFSAQVKAQVLVCHLGSVRFFWFNPSRRLDRYRLDRPLDTGSSREPRYEALLQQCLGRLRKRLPPFWSQVQAGINAVLDYARQKGIQLGFENRERFEELPLDGDFGSFLDSFGADAPVGYWHDTGHADIKERMGLLQHRTHLEGLAERTLGFHVHDVDAHGHDHKPLGAGQVDFEMVSRFWRPEHVLTLEFSPRVSVEEVRASKQRIEALIG